MLATREPLNSAPRDAPRPLLQIAVSETESALFRTPTTCEHFTRSRAESASFEEAPVNENTQTQPAPRLTKRTLSVQPETQSSDKAGKDRTYSLCAFG